MEFARALKESEITLKEDYDRREEELRKNAEKVKTKYQELEMLLNEDEYNDGDYDDNYEANYDDNSEN